MWSWFNFWTSGVSSVHFLDELLVLFGYASGSGAALLEGTLPLRYYTSRFARKVPTWRLHAAGEVASLLPGEGGEAGSVCAAPSVHALGNSMRLQAAFLVVVGLDCLEEGLREFDSTENPQLVRLFRVL